MAQSSDVCSKVRIYLVVLLIGGLWLPLKHLSFKSSKYKRLLARSYEVIFAIFQLGQLILLLIMIMNEYELNINTITRIIVSAASYLSALFFSMFYTITKSRLIHIFHDMKRLCLVKFFAYHQSAIAMHLTRFCMSVAFGYAVIMMGPCVTGMVFYFHSWYNYLHSERNSSDFLQSQRNLELLLGKKFLAYKDEVIQTVPISAVLSLLGLIQKIGVIILITATYGFIERQVRMLESTLEEFLTLESQQLQHWLDYLHQWTRVLKRWNEYYSVSFQLLMACNTVVMCFTAYSFSQLSGSLMLNIFIGMFCFVVVVETFIFCYIGQRIKDAAESLSEAVCRSPWLRAHPKLVPGLTLVALDCRRSFEMRGGPFFTLSLEFFASVVGAVLSYYIVLMQMK